MKKIDILNFITNYRKAPNEVKSYKEIMLHSGVADEAKLNELLAELKQTRVIREVELNGETAFQVVTK